MKRATAIGVLLTMMGMAVYAGMVAILPPLLHSATLAGGVPSTMNQQGVVIVNGVRFTGSAQFRFAIVNTLTGLNLWTNDGTQIGTVNAPGAAVSLSVSDGIYTVALGDAGLTNMVAIPPSVFTTESTALRVWFDDGSHGSQQLSPDHKLTSVGYAMTVADGAVSNAKLADGAVSNAKITDGAVSAAKLASDVATVPVGTLVATALSTAPTGWLLCNGSAVSRTTYAALFAGIGTTFGNGDGSTTFNLPDLRGRIGMGAGAGAGGGASGLGKPTGGAALSSRSIGGWGGEETHTLTVNEMPSHTHGGPDPLDRNIVVGGGIGGSSGLSQTGGPAFRVTTELSYTGGSTAHNIVQPYVVLNYIIKY